MLTIGGRVNQSKKPTAAIILLIIGGVLMLIDGVLMSSVTSSLANLDITELMLMHGELGIPKAQAYLTTATVNLNVLMVVGVASGIIVLLGVLMLYLWLWSLK